MKTPIFAAVLFGVICASLAYVAANGVGARASSAPPVVVDLGVESESSKQAPLVMVEPRTVAPAYDEFGPDPAKPLTRRRSTQSAAPAAPTKPTTQPRQPTKLKRPATAKKEPAVTKPAKPAKPAKAPDKPPREEQVIDNRPVRYEPSVARTQRPKPAVPPPDSDDIEANRKWRRQVIDQWQKEEAERSRDKRELDDALQREFDESGRLRKKYKSDD